MRNIDRHLATLGDQQHGLVTSDQLLEIGLSPDHRRRLALSGRLERVHPGVFRIGGANGGWLQQVHASTLGVRGPALTSHRTAARMLGLDGISDRVIEVVTERWKRPTRRAGVVLHESTDLVRGDCTIIDGIPVTSPVRTLLDLGAVVSSLRLEAALDSASRLRLLQLTELLQRFREVARRGRRGVGRLRPLLAERTGDDLGPDSVFETRMRRLMRDAGLPEPTCQFEVRGAGWVMFLDFAWPSHKVALECDSLAYHLGRRRLQWDDARQNRLVLLGWTVLRFTWRDLVDHPGRVIAQVRAALRRHLGELA